ncbi:alkyl hydroperoxide reductase subunit F [Sorangium sp. So ce1024]|uniref:alkyl hydroperoxide reductase subunit F n=1 Tax=unclassified Sorangium TaxID=2621164 RepID=UPI003EFECEA0
MLEDSIKTQLRDVLGRLTRPVAVTAFVDDSQGSEEMRALLRDVASASPLIELHERREGEERKERTPSFGIHIPGEEPRVFFAGLPLGHELTSLILALLHVGGYPPKVSAEALEQIARLDGELRFETYFSQSCQNCPDVVQALNLMAAKNPRVRHVAVDGALFQGEVEQRKIMAVPTVFLNGEPFGQGRMEIEQILAKLDDGSAVKKRVEALDQRKPFDMLIVGGGPAGASAAIYAARKGLDTGIVAERFGGQVLDTLAIENLISVVETDGPKLAAALEQHVRAYPIELLKHERVESITPGSPFELRLASGATLRAKSVVLATGARWRDMNVPGEAEYRTKGVTYCPHCDGPLFKGKRVAVIGGGNSGVEAAIDLAGVVGHVTLLEIAPALRADAVLVRKLKSMPNVEIITRARTTEVVGDGQKVVGLRWEHTETKEQRQIAVEGVFVQIGLLPNTGFIKGTVELNGLGEVVVNDRGQTSVPGIFAAGDMTTTPFKQIVVALGDGAKAALGAFEHLIRTTAPAE